MQTPWLGLFGDADESIPVDDVERLRSTLDERAPVPHEVVRYPGAQHGFNCDQRPSYNREAVGGCVAADARLVRNASGLTCSIDLAWSRTTAAPTTVAPDAPRLRQQPRGPPAAVVPRARPAGRRDPPVHRRRGQPIRRPPRIEPGRGRADARPAPGVRLARATSSCGTPATRPTSTRSSPGAARTSPRCARPAGCPATRAGASPSTTGSRTATRRRSSATRTVSPRPSRPTRTSSATAESSR